MFQLRCTFVAFAWALLAASACVATEQTEFDESNGPTIVSEHAMGFGDVVDGDLPGAGWTSYRFAAAEGALVLATAEAVVKEVGPGMTEESDCEARHATNPVMMLRGPLIDGEFVHHTVRLSDARDYAACDLDAQVVAVIGATGTYQVLLTDMQEREGPVSLSLSCQIPECRPSCAAGCPEGSSCRAGACVTE